MGGPERPRLSEHGKGGGPGEPSKNLDVLLGSMWLRALYLVIQTTINGFARACQVKVILCHHNSHGWITTPPRGGGACASLPTFGTGIPEMRWASVLEEEP